MTISELIWSEIDNINSQKDSWDAGYLAEKLIILSSYHANLTSHLAEMENRYHKALQLALESYPNLPYNKLESKVKAGDEYLKYKKAVNLEKSVVELTRSLKKFINIKTNEQYTSSNL